MSTWRHWRLSGVGVWNQLNMCNMSGSYASGAASASASAAAVASDACAAAATADVVVIAAF